MVYDADTLTVPRETLIMFMNDWRVNHVDLLIAIDTYMITIS